MVCCCGAANGIGSADDEVNGLLTSYSSMVRIYYDYYN